MKLPAKAIWYIHPYAGGPSIGRYARPYWLSKEWASLGCKSVVVTAAFHHLLDTEQVAGEKAVEGVDYHFIQTPRYSGNGLGRMCSMLIFGWQLLRSRQQLVRHYGRPDVIIYSSPHPYAFLAAWLLAWRLSAKLIFEVRDLWPLSLNELAGVSKWHPLSLLTGVIESFAYKKSDVVVSLLPNTKKYMSQRGLAPEHWAWIPNGVHGDETIDLQGGGKLVDVVSAAKRLGKATIVYAGAVGPPNNMEVFLRAVREYVGRYLREIKVVIVGRGLEWEIIKKMAKDLGLESVIEFIPQVSKQEVMSALQYADIGYVSIPRKNIYIYGVSINKIFDYMACGVPVLFAGRSPNDPVTLSSAGLVVPPDDPIKIAEGMEALLSGALGTRSDLGEIGRQYIRDNHSYSALARKYLAYL